MCKQQMTTVSEDLQGEKYDGRRADVWSCGVILYALLVGALPFDDDNLRQLLEKVKRGVFHIPHFVPPDCQNLLRGMIEVDSDKRLTLAEINRHTWITAAGKGELELEMSMMDVVQTHIIPSKDVIDPDVLQAITSLGCFKEQEKLIEGLLSPHHNTEKVIYFLLLERKRKRPTREDELDDLRTSIQTTKNQQEDPPKKRIDTCRINGNSTLNLGQISQGSPITPRKQLRHEKRMTSSHTSCSSFTSTTKVSPYKNTSDLNEIAPLILVNQYTQPQHLSFPLSNEKKDKHQMTELSESVITNTKIQVQDTTLDTNKEVIHPEINNCASTSGVHHWKSRLNTIKNSFLGSPRFHRRKLLTSIEDVNLTPESSPEFTKKSWFGNLMMTEKDETFTILTKGKQLSTLKADLIHVFLSGDMPKVKKGAVYKKRYQEEELFKAIQYVKDGKF
ncbi:serine/threonine-protein kinase BRSK2-like [Copidosoma floridanum]|uniref:serine/threonine-protein kinase BRSK2-like n=1 Tax=Copidosoma floridanum TaxID=29053 RepID=UPI000C6FC919|nr:serine/threonine-protein kinase BRSK2-like [Copidosoma floridanum]